MKSFKEFDKKPLTEASEITFDELPGNKQRSVKDFQKILKLQPIQYWDGIHGVIVMFTKSPGYSVRLSTDTMKALIKNRDFRWIESSTDGKTVSIGF